LKETAIELKHEELRSAFDRSFQEAPVERNHELAHLLVVRIGNARFALRVSDLARLARTQGVTPLPSADRGLLGLAGLKGRLVAVYSLAAMIGSAALGTEPERWFVLCRTEDRIALAFTAAEGTIMVPSSELCPVSAGAPAHATDAVGSGVSRLWLLDARSIAAAIVASTGRAG
jgi:chemotaxis signal transduction protein